MEKKVDDSLIQKLIIEHRIMLNCNRYKRARPSKTSELRIQISEPFI